MNQAGLSSILVTMALLAIGVIVVAQQPAKIPRIGILAGASRRHVAAWINVAGRDRIGDSCESSTPPFEPFPLGSRDSS
jgi:hypothetical protein